MLRWYEYFDPNRPDNPYGSWYLDSDLGGVCILHTFGPHVFDIIPWFMDSPVVQVYAQGSESTTLYKGQSDSFSATLTQANGTVSTLSQSIVAHSDIYDINFVGSEGSILLTGDTTVIVNRETPGKVFPSPDSSLRTEIEQFARCCIDGITPESDGRSARESMAVIEAVRLSAERNAVVMLSELM